jgi:hypothetical protein
MPDLTVLDGDGPMDDDELARVACWGTLVNPGPERTVSHRGAGLIAAELLAARDGARKDKAAGHLLATECHWLRELAAAQSELLEKTRPGGPRPLGAERMIRRIRQAETQLAALAAGERPEDPVAAGTLDMAAWVAAVRKLPSRGDLPVRFELLHALADRLEHADRVERAVAAFRASAKPMTLRRPRPRRPQGDTSRTWLACNWGEFVPGVEVEVDRLVVDPAAMDELLAALVERGWMPEGGSDAEPGD